MKDLGSGECTHEADDTQDKILYSCAVVSVDDTRKDQELQGLQRHVLALRSELKEETDQRCALQEQLHLQAVSEKNGHIKTVPKSACDSGHLEAENTWQRERAAPRRCESSNAQEIEDESKEVRLLSRRKNT